MFIESSKIQQIWPHSSFATLAAGVAFLLYGLSQSSESLQKLASDRLRTTLNRLGKEGILGVVAGAGLTMLLQSSGALTATLVNLASAQVIVLADAMSLLIGSAIGATFIVELISFHTTDFGLPLFAIGFLFAIFVRQAKWRTFLELAMAVGLIFFGLELIGESAGALFRQNESSAEILNALQDAPILSTLLAALLTGMLQSSTAVLGIVISLCNSKVMTLPVACFWIYGANVGAGSTAFFASLKGNYLGRRIAWANFLYRMVSVLVFLPFSIEAIGLVKAHIEGAGPQVAGLYAAMNLLTAVLLYPLRKQGAFWIERFIGPDQRPEESVLRFLKRSTYDSMALGLAHAKRAAIEMGETIFLMSELSIQLFTKNDIDSITQIRRLDQKADSLLKEIKLFLIRVSKESPEGMTPQGIELISFGSELEAAGDVLDHAIIHLAAKLQRQNLIFGPEALQDLNAIHQSVLRVISLSIAAFQTENPKLCSDANEALKAIQELENKARADHISRLADHAKPDSYAVSAIYLEALGFYMHIAELVTKSCRRAQRSIEKSNQ